MCGVWGTGTNDVEECPVSRVRMGGRQGLGHLWATGMHQRAMTIWHDDTNLRARLKVKK